MLKNFFILIFSISLLFANQNIQSGDKYYINQNYLKAIKYYTIAYKNNHPKGRIKLSMSYLKLGGNFENIHNYKKALSLYNKALNLNSKVAKSKIAKIYEKQANNYKNIRKYKIALNLYKRSLRLGNSNAKKYIIEIKEIFKHKKQLVNDTRKIVSYKSPIWTKSIGRLIIPTKLEFITKKRYKTSYKKCSASLVNIDNISSSKVIITASHCLTAYKKEIGYLKFIIKDNNNQMIHRRATVITDSHYNNKKLNSISDYAILVLDKSIESSEVNPFQIEEIDFLTILKAYKYSFASLAGFSSDIGNYGAKLTYDPKCKLKYHSQTYGASDCSGFKGASGGPVVVTSSNDNINFKYNFVGVVSHFKSDKFNQIYFAPHHIFYSDIIDAIKKYNF